MDGEGRTGRHPSTRLRAVAAGLLHGDAASAKPPVGLNGALSADGLIK
jgi:hypothetical protein